MVYVAKCGDEVHHEIDFECTFTMSNNLKCDNDFRKYFSINLYNVKSISLPFSTISIFHVVLHHEIYFQVSFTQPCIRSLTMILDDSININLYNVKSFGFLYYSIYYIVLHHHDINFEFTFTMGKHLKFLSTCRMSNQYLGLSCMVKEYHQIHDEINYVVTFPPSFSRSFVAQDGT